MQSGRIRAMLVCVLCMCVQMTMSAQGAAAWGVDLQVLQVQPHLYRMSVTYYHGCGDAAPALPAGMHVRERGLETAAGWVELKAYDNGKVNLQGTEACPIPETCMAWERYVGEWQQPQDARYDLHWRTPVPALNYANAAATDSGLTLSLATDAIQGCVLLRDERFAAPPPTVPCGLGVPSAAMAWQGETTLGKLAWAELQGTTPLPLWGTPDNQGVVTPPSPAEMQRLKPCHATLPGEAQRAAYVGKALELHENLLTPIPFKPGSYYLLDVTGPIRHEGKVVGAVHRLWVQPGS